MGRQNNRCIRNDFKSYRAWVVSVYNSVLELISRKCPTTELILTGRGAPKEIDEVANLVTKMKELNIQ